MVKRADDLTSQTLSATDYSQLVTITDNFTKLAERAQVKAQTLKDLTSDENPLTGVNSSAELLEKVQLLAKLSKTKRKSFRVFITQMKILYLRFMEIQFQN